MYIDYKVVLFLSLLGLVFFEILKDVLDEINIKMIFHTLMSRLLQMIILAAILFPPK